MTGLFPSVTTQLWLIDAMLRSLSVAQSSWQSWASLCLCSSLCPQLALGPYPWNAPSNILNNVLGHRAAVSCLQCSPIPQGCGIGCILGHLGHEVLAGIRNCLPPSPSTSTPRQLGKPCFWISG